MFPAVFNKIFSLLIFYSKQIAHKYFFNERKKKNYFNQVHFYLEMLEIEVTKISCKNDYHIISTGIVEV